MTQADDILTVKVSVRGGVLEVLDLPEGIELVVMDWDNENREPGSGGVIYRNEAGQIVEY